ncbi:hypothetical protein B0H11DRAFT_2032019 [Mycena galericulata]|nr:hypothetical protein B0H11DRAFT_2032019 [Mycena galericulata]
MNDPPATQDSLPAHPPAYALGGHHGVQHQFPLLDKQGKQWGILICDSSARSSRATPLFYEDDTIWGSVQMVVEKGDSMRSVTVKIAGSVVTGSNLDDRKTFWKFSTTLWTRGTSPPEIGHHTWPFAVPIPSEVSIAHDGSSATFRLPESFLERHTRATVLYDISVVVSRGFLRADSTFKTRFRYIPCTRPNPPSALRQEAYRFNHSLAGPRDDPEGWYTSATTTAHGNVFGMRQADVQCMLSLALPLCYTRGSVIPCYLTLESEDLDALSLFAAPDTVQMHLRRCVRYQGTSLAALAPVGPAESRATLAAAVWWPHPEEDGAHTRTLEGEIRVGAELVSTSAMGHFRVEYTVELLPPDSLGFTAANGGTLVSVPIEIATMHVANVPRPVVYTPI